MKPKLFSILLPAALSLSSCERRQLHPQPTGQSPADPPGAFLPIIETAIRHPEALENIPFADVVRASSGREIIPIDPTLPADAELLGALRLALNHTLAQLNRPDSPARSEKRINEVSSHFEKSLRSEIDSTDGFLCAPPTTNAGKNQHTGYPDLRIVHQETGQVTYLDPKLIAPGTLDSSLRTFYFTPKGETGKIQNDAHHLLVGIEHDGNTGQWKFTAWHLVDLASLKVRLKTEFQANNQDLYQGELILMEETLEK